MRKTIRQAQHFYIMHVRAVCDTLELTGTLG